MEILAESNALALHSGERTPIPRREVPTTTIPSTLVVQQRERDPLLKTRSSHTSVAAQFLCACLGARPHGAGFRPCCDPAQRATSSEATALDTGRVNAR
jgi:hypothetical protein